MRKNLIVFLVAAFTLSGCSSNLNPFNWFGGDGPDDSVTRPVEEKNPLIPEQRGFSRPPDVYQGTTIDVVSDLSLERVPGGLIIRATGQSAQFGAFNAQLTPTDPDEEPVEGVLTYQLDAEYTPTVASNPDSREVIVARKLTDQQLGDTRTIRVQGLQNVLERRR